MNNRIRELADQAGVLHHKHYDLGRTLKNGEEVEKFAELIVRECIDILNSRHNNFVGSKTEYARGFKSGLDAATQTVKSYFGIEE